MYARHALASRHQGRSDVFGLRWFRQKRAVFRQMCSAEGGDGDAEPVEGEMDESALLMQDRPSRSSRHVGQNVSEGVLTGTMKWVREWIVARNVCPFAKESDYRVIVSDRTDMGTRTKMELMKLARGLMEPNMSSPSPHPPNLLVVYPYVPMFINQYRFYEFYLLQSDICAVHIETWPWMYDSESRRKKLQIFWFHPEPYYSPAKQGYQVMHSMAPFPTLHLMRRVDLDHARGLDGLTAEEKEKEKKNSISSNIIDHNHWKIEDSEENRDAFVKLFKKCQRMGGGWPAPGMHWSEPRPNAGDKLVEQMLERIIHDPDPDTEDEERQKEEQLLLLKNKKKRGMRNKQKLMKKSYRDIRNPWLDEHPWFTE
ncbi:hypothetical protein FVE85_4396 [Porphyridium purpureum]|uniref:Uncharacterized protein n=1 Tax=Porphyridium purpureum TaxID=35688 RepID=A0A5J4YHY2_PORPP|nr:hypothetical protein FVE85_4396 [Porphyridium purpureum]|eukprot:POR5269..scf270_19